MIGFYNLRKFNITVLPNVWFLIEITLIRDTLTVIINRKFSNRN